MAAGKVPMKKIPASRRAAPKVTVLGRPSWKIACGDVEANVSEAGGMLAPVTFDRRGRKIRPFSVAPWATEKLARSIPPIIAGLRGDFFCMPFGGNETAFGRERHPVHGETANARWKFESITKTKGECTLHLSLQTKIRKGRVDKTITLRDGHPAIYSRHLVSNLRGPMPLGHHAMLKFPDDPASGMVSTSRFVYGQVFPGEFEKPDVGGYPSLKPGARFESLEAVPMTSGEIADLTRFPARKGFEDLVMIVSSPDVPFAWTAVSFPRQRYLWFALKDPAVLRETVFWFSNGGRHYAPWSGRHTGVLGLEEITGNFHYGLAESAQPNPIAAEGFPTFIHFTGMPVEVNTIMACVPTPAGFDRVASIEEAEPGHLVIVRSDSGKSLNVPLHVEFLKGQSA